MKYLALLYGDQSKGPAPGTPEMDKMLEGYNNFFAEVSGNGVLQSGDPVQGPDAASTVRVRDGVSKATSGPFASGAEQVIGYYVLDCADQAEAEKYAAKIPAASSGAVEVRPILVM